MATLTEKIELGLGGLGFAGTLGGVGKIIHTELTHPKSVEDILTGAYITISGCLIGIGSGLPSRAREKSKKLGIEISNYRELVKEWWPVIKEYLPLYGMYEFNKNMKTQDRNASETLRRLRSDGYDIVNDNYHCLVSIAPTFGAMLYFLDKSGLIK